MNANDLPHSPGNPTKRHRMLAAILMGAMLVGALQASEASAAPTSGSCTDPAGCIVVGPGEPIRLGTFVVTDFGVFGRESAQAVELAVDSRGDIAGHPIQLTHLGDGCVPGLATTTAEAAAAERVLVGVIGTSCSVAARPVAPILGGAGITMISPSNTGSDLTEPGTRDPFYFRTANNDTYQGDALAEYLIDQGHETAATVVAEGNPSMVIIGQRFVDRFEFLGGTAADPVAVADDGDYTSELGQIAAEPPDVIVFLLFQGAAFVSQARDLTPDLDDTTLATGDFNQGLVDELSSLDTEGMVFSGWDFGFLAEEPYLSTLHDPYVATFEEEPTTPYHAYAFDAANRLMDVIASFQKGNSPKLTIPRTALRDAFAATSNYPGVTGPITCDPNGDCNPQEVVILVVQGGVLVEQ